MSERDPSQRETPVIRDKRRIDPRTGEVRQSPYDAESGSADPLSPGWTPPEGDDWEQQPGGYPGSYEEPYGFGQPGYPDQSYAGPTAAYTEQATSAYADSAAYTQPVDPAWSYESPPAPPAAPAPPAEGEGEAAAVRQELAERTADLQRLQAEYANYRRRVERDRGAVQEQALVNVVTNLLPLLDDVARARDHGDLTGGFKSVGEALEATVEKLGLARFGEPGEPFDPVIHEALTHTYSDEVSEPTAVAVLQPGYRLGERVLRPARVAVAEPE